MGSRHVDAPIQLRRMLDRVETVELVRRGDCPEEVRHAIGLDLAERIAWWTPPLRSEVQHGARFRGATGMPSGVKVVLWPFMICATGMLSASKVGVYGVFIVAAGLIGVAVLLRGRSFAKSWSMVDRFCPDCNYDLSGNDDGVDAALLGTVRVGPAKCPECGMAWPLVPPPIPS